MGEACGQIALSTIVCKRHSCVVDDKTRGLRDGDEVGVDVVGIVVEGIDLEVGSAGVGAGVGVDNVIYVVVLAVDFGNNPVIGGGISVSVAEEDLCCHVGDVQVVNDDCAFLSFGRNRNFGLGNVDVRSGDDGTLEADKLVVCVELVGRVILLQVAIDDDGVTHLDIIGRGEVLAVVALATECLQLVGLFGAVGRDVVGDVAVLGVVGRDDFRHDTLCIDACYASACIDGSACLGYGVGLVR